MSKRTSWLAAALCALPLACSGGGAGDPGPAGEFQYRSSEDLSLHVTVTKFGLPVTGASVSVVEVLTEADLETAETSGTPFFAGGTDTSGICESIVSIPTSVDRVDLVVHHDGSRGSFTDEGLRTHWGSFAPSSRTTLRVADLGAVVVELEDR